MGVKVGPKGTVVIEKSIREQLGIQPGWEVLQVLRGDRVELHFLPPAQSGSAFGCLQAPPGIRPLSGRELRDAVADAVAGTRHSESETDAA